MASFPLTSGLNHSTPVYKSAAGCVFSLLLALNLFPCPRSFFKTLFFNLPSMFYQEVWEECTSLINIIVFPEASKPKPPYLCDVLGKPIRFIERIFVRLVRIVPFFCALPYFWKMVCNQGVSRAKLSIEHLWIQLDRR